MFGWEFGAVAIASGLRPVRSLFELMSEWTIAVQSCKCFAERVNWVFVLVVLVNSTGQKGSKRVLWGSDKTHCAFGSLWQGERKWLPNGKVEACCEVSRSIQVTSVCRFYVCNPAKSPAIIFLDLTPLLSCLEHNSPLTLVNLLYSLCFSITLPNANV